MTKHSSDKAPLAIDQTRDGRVLVFCHAGCDQPTVIAALQVMGLWPEGELTMDPSYPGQFTTKHDGSDNKEERRTLEYARELWDRAVGAKSTPVEDYLRARGVRLPMSSELRYLPRLKHGASGQTFRAMIARVSDNYGFVAIQRTYLDNDRPAKASILDAAGDAMKVKLSLAKLGEGAVRLRMPSGDTLGIAEGIETALSADQLYAMPVWATLSAHRLARIEIPKTVRFLHIFGDAGEVGRREAFAAADEYERRGLHTEVVFPAAHFKAPGKDFNNIVQDGAARA